MRKVALTVDTIDQKVTQHSNDIFIFGLGIIIGTITLIVSYGIFLLIAR